MRRNTILLALATLTTVFSSAYAQQASFRSANFPERFVRHRSFEGFLELIEAQDGTGRKDASYWVRPGLAGSCASLEAVNLPGFFLRHQNFRLVLSKSTPDRLFQEDATFCISNSLTGSNYSSLESFNRRGHFVRHKNFELLLHRKEETDLFKQDASFAIQWTSLAVVPVQSAIITRVERHQQGAWINISGNGFTPGGTVRFWVEGLNGVPAPKSIGPFANVRPDGSFDGVNWNGTTWSAGGNARLRAFDQATGLSTTAAIPPLY
jgi:hypothetical protein